MKKSDKDINIFNQQFSSNKEVENSAQKTTNINILLNRVRLDKKKVLKKKIIFSIIVISLVSSLAIFFTL